MNFYSTSSGDTFDKIALKSLGDVAYVKHIILENVEYADVLIFDSGIKLKIPQLPEETEDDFLPPWKRRGGKSE